MAAVGQIVIFILISLSAGWISHALVRRGKWGWAAGLLVFSGGAGAVLYAMIGSAGIIGALGLAIIMVMICLPIAVGTATGMLVGLWSKRL